MSLLFSYLLPTVNKANFNFLYFKYSFKYSLRSPNLLAFHICMHVNEMCVFSEVTNSKTWESHRTGLVSHLPLCIAIDLGQVLGFPSLSFFTSIVRKITVPSPY